MSDAIADAGRHTVTAWQTLEPGAKLALAATGTVAATAPLWRQFLVTGGELFYFAGAMLAFVSGVLAFRKVLQAGGDVAASGRAVLDATGLAAKSGARVPHAAIGAAVAAIVIGLFAWLSSGSAHAATIPQAAKVSRRASDAAGDDGDSDAEPVPEGAPAWYARVHELIGTQEALSSGRCNPVVQAMFPAVGLSANADCRRIPWCSVFVNFALKGEGYPVTGSAMARSWLRWGVSLDTPRMGCVVVMWRGKYDDGESGHVGFFEREDARFVYVLGGNQGDAVSVARFPKSRVLGYRWPRKLIQSGTVRGALTAKLGAVATGGALATDAVLDTPKLSDWAATVEAAREPVRMIAETLPRHTRLAQIAAFAGVLLTVAGAYYAFSRRRADFRETGE